MEFKEQQLKNILEINPRMTLKKGTVTKKIAMEHLTEYVKQVKGYELSEFKSGSKFKNKDTLVARITPCLENGKTAYVDILADDEVAFGSTEFFVVRAKENKGDPQFIYYLMRHPKVRDATIKSMTGTSGRQRAQKEAILEYSMSLPNIFDQKKIGYFLSLFDSKIEANNDTIHNLEQLSQTLFKHWFIDFEFPNEEGKPYKSSGGEMVESELGEIPKGWTVNTLGNIVNVIDNRGKTPPLVKDNFSFPIIDVKALAGNSRVIDYTNCRKFVSAETYKTWFRKGHPESMDTLLSTVGSIGELKLFYYEKGCVAQNVVALRSKDISKLYIYEFMRSIKSDLVTYNIGSVQPSIKVTHIMKKQMLIPPSSILKKYDDLALPITQQIFSLDKENQNLQHLRDTLLPKLLSGEIEIPDELEV